MATKSSNTKGNPYHSESDGRFTSADGQSGKSSESGRDSVFRNSAGDAPKAAKKALTPDEVSAIKKQIAQKLIQKFGNPYRNKANPNFELTMPVDLADAERQGNAILGYGPSARVVQYDQTTDLKVAHEFNRALLDMVKMFPRVFDNTRILSYGTGRIDMKSKVADYAKIAEAHLNDPVVKKAFADYGVDPSVYKRVFLDASVFFQAQNLNSYMGDGTGGQNVPIFDLSERTTDRTMPASFIQLNPKHSTSLEAFDRYCEKGVEGRAFLPINSDKGLSSLGAYSVAVHELGHIVTKSLKVMLGDEAWSREYMQKVFGATAADSARLMRTRLSMLWNGEISGYACANGGEAEAEAFANYFANGSNCTKTNRRIIETLKGLYHSVFE